MYALMHMGAVVSAVSQLKEERYVFLFMKIQNGLSSGFEIQQNSEVLYHILLAHTLQCLQKRESNATHLK